MDTSKEYIKMCEGAEEIQKIARDKCYRLNKGYDAVMHFIEDTRTELQEDGFYQGIWVWLPRQDQLQEMMKGKPDHLLIILVNWTQDNIKYYKSGRIKKLYPTKSMEQLWLAFVMKEKFNKAWDNKEWSNL